MSTGSWDPQQGTSNTPVNITQAQLQRFISVAEDEQALSNLEAHLSKDEQALSGVMTMDLDNWNSLLSSYDTQQLTALIRFFTLAEMQLNGWQAGAKSPVIAITKLLKRQGHALDKELLLWIKTHSTNRFLPNGAILSL